MGDLYDLAETNPYTLETEQPQSQYEQAIGGQLENDPYIVPMERRQFRDDRYKKTFITTAIVDSRDRDTTAYPNPNNFVVNLGKSFEYVDSIRLVGVNIDATLPPVNNNNNQLRWTYPSEPPANCQLVPGIPNEDLPADYYTICPVIHKAVIQPGFHTTDSLPKETTKAAAAIPHSEDEAVRRQGLVPPDSTHEFYFELDEITHRVCAVNRIETLETVVVQTLVDDNGDILAPYITGGTGCSGADANAVFITVKDEGTHDFGGGTGPTADASLYPLVPTNIPPIGGIPEDLINFVEFWDHRITTDQPYYEFCNVITIGDAVFRRYKIFPMTTVGGVLQPIAAKQSQTFVSNKSLEPVLNSAAGGTGFETTFVSSDQEDRYECYLNAAVGRALPTAFLFDPINKQTDQAICDCDERCEPNEIQTTILEKYKYDMEPDPNGCEFGYVLCNGTRNNPLIPNGILEIEKDGAGEYVFRGEDYLILKIGVPFRARDFVGGNMVKAANHNAADFKQNPTLYSCYGDKSNLDNLFAQVYLSPLPPNRSTDFVASPMYFYEQPLDRVEELIVTLVDRNGVPIRIKQNFNFTLEFTELREVLHHTLMDSRNGSTVLTGYKNYYD